jgi:hypothetical protein
MRLPRVDNHNKERIMLIKLLTTKRFWQLAVLVTVAAIPIILLAGKHDDSSRYIPESGDDSDLFDGNS